MALHSIKVRTTSRTEFVEITSDVITKVSADSIKNGIVVVYCPHTTAGITINENADPDVQYDMLKELNRIVMFNNDYKHMEGNSAAHIKASIMGSSSTIPLKEGSLVLGTWQGIYFCEFDGARNRTVYVQIISE